MSTSIDSFFLSSSYGDGATHAARLYLSAWLCDHGTGFSVVLFRPNFMLVSEGYPMKAHKNQ
jgi:hypothetical protein